MIIINNDNNTCTCSNDNNTLIIIIDINETCFKDYSVTTVEPLNKGHVWGQTFCPL